MSDIHILSDGATVVYVSVEAKTNAMCRGRYIVAIIAAWVFAIPAWPADSPNWRFVVVGDSRGGSVTGVNEQVLSELVHEFLQRDVDFVLFPGDLVFGGGVSCGEFEKQLWTWIRVMQPLYEMGIRVYACRGNHEIGDMWYEPLDQPPDPIDNYGKRWLNVFASGEDRLYRLPDNGPAGERFMTYSVVHRNALIVGLDQYGGMNYHPLHYVNQDWLSSELESNVKPHVFVFSHEEAFRTLHYDCMDAHPDRRDAFWLSLKVAGGRTYFSCHDHYYDHARIDDGDGNPDNDLHQFIVATGGAPLYTWPGPYDGNNGDFVPQQVCHVENRYGYLLVNVDDLEVTTAWMERRSMNPEAPAFYDARDLWKYRISPNIVVLRPRPGERVPAEQSYTIRWKTIEGAQARRVRIEYSLDGGSGWYAIGETDNTDAYEWLTPAVNSKSCLVRITGVGNPKLDDTTDSTFSISKCPVDHRADLNGDCRVDAADLAILAGEWLAGSQPK